MKTFEDFRKLFKGIELRPLPILEHMPCDLYNREFNAEKGIVSFCINSDLFTEWLNKQGYIYYDGFFEGCLIDNFFFSVNGFNIAVYEHYVNCWSTDYLVKAQFYEDGNDIINEWDAFEAKSQVDKVKAYFDWAEVINPGNLERFALHIEYLNIEYVVNNLDNYRLDPSMLANYFIEELGETIETIIGFDGEEADEWEEQELCSVLDEVYAYLSSLIEEDIEKHKAEIIEVLRSNADSYLLYDCTAKDLIDFIS